jgi:hypothetical protein
MLLATRQRKLGCGGWFERVVVKGLSGRACSPCWDNRRRTEHPGVGLVASRSHEGFNAKANVKDLLRDIGLLLYNCVSNCGSDFLPEQDRAVLEQVRLEIAWNVIEGAIAKETKMCADSVRCSGAFRGRSSMFLCRVYPMASKKCVHVILLVVQNIFTGTSEDGTVVICRFHVFLTAGGGVRP